MKKHEIHSKKVNPLENKAEYYKTVGEKAAIYTFTKNSLSHKKLSSISPPSKLVFLKEESQRKSDLEVTPMLSPLSRDISHLRDKFQIITSSKLTDLPPDLKSVKKLYETTDQNSLKHQSLPFIFKDFSLEKLHQNNSSELPSIEKLLFGPPTGRQEIVHLKKWFESMKEDPKYDENEENKKLLHVLCSKELIKQVSVHCLERGELLHEVIEYFIGKIEKHKENLDVALKNTAKLKKVVIDEFKQREEDLNAKLKKLELECFYYQGDISRKNQEILKISKELEREQEKIEELKVRLGTDDLSTFKGFRMMHKNTNITWKTRDSLFTSTINLKNRDALKFDVETQTEIVTYARKIPKLVQRRKFVDEESMTVDIGPEDLPQTLLVNSDRPSIQEMTEPKSPKETLDPFSVSEKQKKEDSMQIITVCDQDCQTAYAIDIFFYDYIEANIDRDSFSLEPDEEESWSKEDSLFSDFHSDLLKNSKKAKRKSSRIKKISPRLSAQFEKRKNSKINEPSSKNALETIADKSSAEENAQVENFSDDSEEFIDKKGPKTAQLAKSQKVATKNKEKRMINGKEQIESKSRIAKTFSSEFEKEDNSKRRRSNIPFKFPDRGQNKAYFRKSTSNVSVRVSELPPTSPQLTLDNVSVQDPNPENPQNLTPIKKPLKSTNSSQSPKKNTKMFKKLPTISINELETHAENQILEKSLQSENSSLEADRKSKRSSLSVFSENNEKNPGLFQKSQTANFLNPSDLKETSFKSEDQEKKSSQSSRSISMKSKEMEEDDSFEELSDNLENPENPESPEDAKREKSRKLSKKNTIGHLTEFALFQFNRKGLFKDIQKKNPAKKLVAGLLNKKDPWFKKRATISRKMVNKTMSVVYLSYHSKAEKSETLSEHLYNDFIGRYGINKVANRKFIEFISSLLSCEDSKRARVFLRFIGAGLLINSSNFSEETLNFYLNSLVFMINSKVGITTYDETQDKIMFPTARAVECAKEKLQNFDKNILNRVLLKLDKNKISDPKKINYSGLVEGEMFLETLAEVFENVRSHIISGVELVLAAVKYQENLENIEKYEASIIFKELCPAKSEELEQFFIGKDFISLSAFISFCVDKSVLNINQIFAVVPNEKLSIDEVWNIVKSGTESLYMAIDEIRASKSVILNDPPGFWDTKLEKLLRGVSERETYETCLAYRIFSSELMRLKSQIH